MTEIINSTPLTPVDQMDYGQSIEAVERQILQTHQSMVMGSLAVERSNIVTQTVLDFDNDSGMSAEQSAFATALLDSESTKAVEAERRSWASAMTPRQRGNLGQAIESLKPPEFLLHATNSASVSEMITNLFSPDGKVPTEAVANFFQWHMDAIAERQKAFESNEQGVLLEEYSDRLDLYSGWLPHEAIDRFSGFRDNNRLRVLLSDFEDIHDLGGSEARHKNGLEVVRLKVNSSGEEREHTYAHELTHAVSGSRHPESEANAEIVLPKDRGLKRLFGDGSGGTAIEEATTEHFADSMIHGNLHVINPIATERSHSKNIYPAERFFLLALCRGGKNQIDPKLFVQAMMSDGEPDASQYMQQLKAELEASFPGMKMIEQVANLKVESDQSSDKPLIALAKSIFEQTAQLNVA